MPISLYDISVPAFIRGLNTLSHILKKAEDYANEKGIPHDEFLSGSLAEDMKPLLFQIQTASNTAKNACARVADTEAVPMKDNEATFAELQSRVSKTIEVLNAVEKEKFEGTEEKEVLLKVPETELKFTGTTYLLQFAIPNFYFHVTTAYAILRMKSVPLGKADYFGGGQS